MMASIYFFGDSINFGQGVSVERNWVTRIGLNLNRGGKGNIVIQNPSVNGNTTRMALERMPFDVQSHKVDILVVTFGMNDCNYWKSDQGMPRVSPDAFEANMKEIIMRGFHFGSRTVIIHTNHPSPRTDFMAETGITYSESNHFYNNIIRKIASENTGAVFVDIETIMMNMVSKKKYKVSDYTQKDGVHLSRLGNDVYYENICPVIERELLKNF